MEHSILKMILFPFFEDGSMHTSYFFYNLSEIVQEVRDYHNGAPKTGGLKNVLITLWKVTPWNARDSVVSGRKKVARPFVRRKKVSTSVEI